MTRPSLGEPLTDPGISQSDGSEDGKQLVQGRITKAIAHAHNLSLGHWWLIAAAILCGYFYVWWLHFRPGVLSYDSGFYLNEVVTGELTNLKPFLYARFLQVVTLNGALLEMAVVVQGLLVVLAFSRMFAIAIVTRTRIAWIAISVVLVLNPYVANMMFYIQNDTLFSVAVVTLTVETLYVARQRRVSFASCVIFALFAPMALFFRQNGLLFLPLCAVVLLIVVSRPQWLRIALPMAITTLVASASMIGVKSDAPGQSHDLLYPAVIHEVVNLARPGFRTAVGARLAPETQAAIGMERLPLATQYYWPLYWDTIAFFPDGPKLLELAPEQRNQIVRSFLRHDLLPNAQSILAHRLEMFLGASLARAELADPYAVPANLPTSIALSKSRQAVVVGEGSLLGGVNRWSMSSRAWTWNAMFGVGVLALLSIGALWRRDVPLLLCALIMWVQAAVIFVVAPSAEYRYVFALYLAPMLLLVGHHVNRQPTDTTVDSHDLQ